MAVEALTDDEFDAFLTKLSAVDFTDKERSLLGGLFATAGPGEVQGFDKTGGYPSATPSQLAVLNNLWPPKLPGASPEQQKQKH